MKSIHAIAAAALLAATSAFAQDYPARSISFAVPFAAGSATDQLARGLAQSIATIIRAAAIQPE